MTTSPRDIVARVERVVTQAGSDPWLVGYDANGIQELITASGRPISMRGASEAILGFDNALRDRSIFAGGGRGVVLARSREDAARQQRALVNDYRVASAGGVLATCAVPLSRGGDGEAQSIRWLRHTLEIAKDAALPPGGTLPGDKDSECAYCRRYRAERKRKRDDRVELVCVQCDEMLNRGRDIGLRRGERLGEMSLSIADIAVNGWIAVTSADGNNLGNLFESLASLNELAVVSQAVADSFKAAQERAISTIAEQHRLSLVTGGDDVRAFLRPGDVLGYVDALAHTVEAEATNRAATARDLVSASTAERLRKLGIGIGAVIANVYYPAWRLIDHAHALELSAKAACRQHGWRSGLDIAVVTAEGAMMSAPGRIDGREHVQGDVLPVELCSPRWHAAQSDAQKLLQIPSAQLAVLATAPESDEELANLLRYQVARSGAWQSWYGVEWSDREAVFQRRPTRGALMLARVLQFARQAGRDGAAS